MTPQEGNIIAVHTDGWAAKWIRRGERLLGIDSKTNHIAVLHHLDPNGTPWALEGRPGGVGWVDASSYLASPWTVSNAAQPIDPTARLGVIRDGEAMLKVGYDDLGIFGDACRDLHLPELWGMDWKGQGPPGHVVCSSYAAYLYDHHGLPRPEPRLNGRWVEPGDWAGWIRKEGWR